MHPHSKHQPLFFTPRSPWGGRLKNQSFRRHMRASEDKKLMAPPKEQLDRSGVPRSLSGQTTPDRIREIQDASIQLPPYDVQRMPAPEGGASAPKPQLAPQAKDIGIAQAAKMGQNPNLAPVTGGPQNTIPPAPQSGTLKPPALNFKNGKIEFDWEKMFESHRPALKGEYHF